MIVESNLDVERLVNYLDEKVKQLKTKYPDSALIPKMKEFYDVVVIHWMEEYQLDSIEIEDQYDEDMKNKILDRILWIDKILKKQ